MKKMTVNEAQRILHLKGTITKESLHKAYIGMIKQHHPDNFGTNQAAAIMNEAYALLLEASISDNGSVWDAEVNEEVFCGRPIYEEHRLQDGIVYPILMAEGKYMWNPESEEFSMLMKSLYEVTEKLVKGKNVARVFHYLMQEYVDPIYALEHIAKDENNTWKFKCHCKTYGRNCPTAAILSKLYAIDGENQKPISFPDKALHYVITPLVGNGAGKAEVCDDSLTFELTGKAFVRDYQKANSAIKKLLD